MTLILRSESNRFMTLSPTLVVFQSQVEWTSVMLQCSPKYQTKDICLVSWPWLRSVPPKNVVLSNAISSIDLGLLSIYSGGHGSQYVWDRVLRSCFPPSLGSLSSGNLLSFQPGPGLKLWSHQPSPSTLDKNNKDA